jgi:hypothetical protein
MFGKGKKRGAFWRGYASALSLYPNHVRRTKVRTAKILVTSSAEALAQDWRMVGADLYSAVSRPDERSQSSR